MDTRQSISNGFEFQIDGGDLDKERGYVIFELDLNKEGSYGNLLIFISKS